MRYELNRRAEKRLEQVLDRAAKLRIAVETIAQGGRFIDFGVEQRGGLQAGLELARLCTADYAEVSLTTTSLAGGVWPCVQVASDHPAAACLFSQYAGWEIKTEKFFALGSGPMRAAAACEELFGTLCYRESADRVFGVLETDQLPDASVYAFLAEACGVPAENVDLAGASVCSAAGNLQVVARSLETALHKLLEVGFDVKRVVSGFGTAPLSPVAKNTLRGIGRTNDAILYGSAVTLWVTGDDASLERLGPQVPSDSSDAYGRPFACIFEEAGRDFYNIDRRLFSPAVVVFNNLQTGSVYRFGRINEEVLRESFGW